MLSCSLVGAEEGRGGAFCCSRQGNSISQTRSVRRAARQPSTAHSEPRFVLANTRREKQLSHTSRSSGDPSHGSDTLKAVGLLSQLLPAPSQDRWLAPLLGDDVELGVCWETDEKGEGTLVCGASVWQSYILNEWAGLLWSRRRWQGESWGVRVSLLCVGCYGKSNRQGGRNTPETWHEFGHERCQWWIVIRSSPVSRVSQNVLFRVFISPSMLCSKMECARDRFRFCPSRQIRPQICQWFTVQMSTSWNFWCHWVWTSFFFTVSHNNFRFRTEPTQDVQFSLTLSPLGCVWPTKYVPTQDVPICDYPFDILLKKYCSWRVSAARVSSWHIWP